MQCKRSTPSFAFLNSSIPRRKDKKRKTKMVKRHKWLCIASLSAIFIEIFAPPSKSKMASCPSPHYRGNHSARFVKDAQGKMIYQARDLNIVWGGDDRYWNIPNEDSRPVQLYQVSWLEITGFVNETNPNKNYEVGFSVSFTADAFGWGISPIYIMVRRGDNGKFSWKKFMLEPNGTEAFEITASCIKVDKTKQLDPTDHKLYFGLYEIWSGKWKGGLKIHHAFVKEISP